MVVVPIYIPTNSVGKVPFSPNPLQHFVTCVLMNDSHSDGCEWYLIVVLISLVISDIEHFFVCLSAICISSLEKCLFWSFAHFSIGLLAFWLLSCISGMYILEIKPLSVASFETIFSYSLGCRHHLLLLLLLLLFNVSFAVQKLVSLIRSHWFICVLFLLPWETDLRKHL
uniref:Uncharacterized protein n=2 Tax=Sus scrofa TaxID=9823 RepID=A0A8W4FK28_PIG